MDTMDKFLKNVIIDKSQINDKLNIIDYENLSKVEMVSVHSIPTIYRQHSKEISMLFPAMN